MAKNLWKTTIVIWSDFDPQEVEIDSLAREAVQGESYCSTRHDALIAEPEKDDDWEDTEFFESGFDDA